MGRLTPLHQNLIASYTLDELAVLCGSLDIPFEHLRGETLPARAWSLLRYADRHDKLPELVAQCAKDFPNRDWQVPPPRQPGEPDDDELPAGGVQVKVEGVSGAVNIGGIAEVRTNTGQVAVGSKNVIQIGSLNVPRWLAIALPLLLVAVLVVAGIGTAGVLSVTTPTPTPVIGPTRMTGSFNIAVADFPETDIDGRQKSTDDGFRLSTLIYQNLKKELGDIASAQVWHDSLPLAEKGATIGVITGATVEERQTAAAKLANDLGAHMVIYGNLKKSGNMAELEPEFYVSTAAIALPKETAAEDITGRHQLGAPVQVPLPFKAEAGLGVGVQLETRALFVRGLLYDLIGQHDKALADFRTCKLRWAEQAGQGAETLDFFLGREALFLWRKEPLAIAAFGSITNALDFAQDSFSATLQSNPNYALGHWGLGTTYFRRAEPVINAALDSDIQGTQAFSDAVANINAAISHYQSAIESTPADAKPELAAKMRTSLANGLRLDGLARLLQGDDAGAKERMEESLEQVNHAFRQIGDQQPRARATAYFVRGAGYVAQGALAQLEGDLDLSKTFYQKAKADFEACLNQYDDPQSKQVIDESLTDIRNTNCKPNLDLVNQALGGG